MSRLFKFLTSGPRLFWLPLFLVTWALSTWSFALYKALDARWIIRFPKQYELPLDVWISSAMSWLVEEAHFGFFSFRDLTRFIAAVIELPYQMVRSLLIDGFSVGQGQQAIEIAPSISWIAIIGTMAALA